MQVNIPGELLCWDVLLLHQKSIKLDYICLPCANGDSSSLLLCMITSSFCRVPNRIDIILCLGDANSGISFIFKCLFLWNIFLIRENTKKGPSSYCIVLWSNAPIVWASLLHKMTFLCQLLWTFFCKYPPEFITVLRQRMELFIPNICIYQLCVHLPFFSFCNSFTVLWLAPTFPLSFSGFFFSVSWIILN